MAVFATVTGSVGTTATAAFTVAMPSSIPDGSVLVFASGTNTGTLTCDLSGLTNAETTVVGPTRSGTVWSSYLWIIPVGSADSDATLTVTWSGAGRPVGIGAIHTGMRAEITSGAPLVVAASSGTMPTVTDQGGDTGEIVTGRHASANPAFALPSPYTNDATVTSGLTSGIRTAGAIGIATGTGGGTVTSSPVADRLIGYTYNLEPADTLAGSASGASTSSGSAAITQTMRVSASGASTSTGSANATIVAGGGALIATASGASASSGSAAITMRMRAAASGGSVSSGSAATTSVMRASASGASVSSGSAEATLRTRVTLTASPLRTFVVPREERRMRIRPDFRLTRIAREKRLVRFGPE